ncbi:sensor domain-containing diguanylate cyclase [Aliamphritea hakodatensis]|uniref:sensor domain-containing diguanylate cyclase n=1 Tax=Aliamphritea hakodatensis TaxID=2895352 RepID=UPI0022FD7B0C|nr:GGDEF domain-containing protein [Aliamphritea hakodatensis]
MSVAELYMESRNPQASRQQGLFPCWLTAAVLLLLLFSSNVLANTDGTHTFHIQPNMDGEVMTPYMQVLEDPDCTLSFADVQKPYWQNRFTPINNNQTAHGVSSSAWWIRISAANHSDKSVDWILEALHNITDYIDVYQLDAAGNVSAQQLGDHRPYAINHLPSEAFSFPLKTPAGEQQTIYLRFNFEHAGVINLYLEASTPEAYVQKQHIQGIWLGIFLGAAILVMVYTLFLMLSIREKPYFWYLLYASAAVVMYLALSGLGYRYIWGFTPTLADAIPHFAIVAFYSLAIQFSRSFLDTDKQAPQLDALLLLLLGITAFSGILLIINIRELALNLLMLTGLALGLFPAIGIYLWSKGQHQARGYTLAWSIWSITVICGILRFQGIIPTSNFAIGATRFGMILETILLAFALVDRVNILRKEKLAAEERERLAAQQATDQLETKVKERTRELELARQHAEKLASQDSLSGLFNRRAFFQQGNTEVHRARRYDQTLSVMMLDIDHFKQINDQHGHAAGDRVISTVASILNEVLRESDIKARIGGEEFAVVLVQTPRNKALHLAERIRDEIQHTPISSQGMTVNITASFGIAELTEDSGGGTTLDQLLARADKALYWGKNNGRNRVTGYTAPATAAEEDLL